ncbi:MAG: hypothetical protein EA393_13190, partial [Bacteroidetes bacterium]
AGSAAKNRKLDEVNLAAILLLTINTKKPTAGSAAKDLLVKVNSKFEYRSTKRIKIRTNKAKTGIGKPNRLGWHPLQPRQIAGQKTACCSPVVDIRID